MAIYFVKIFIAYSLVPARSTTAPCYTRVSAANIMIGISLKLPQAIEPTNRRKIIAGPPAVGGIENEKCVSGTLASPLAVDSGG